SRARRPPPRGRSPPSTATTDIGFVTIHQIRPRRRGGAEKISALCLGVSAAAFPARLLLVVIQGFVEARVAFLAGGHPHLEPLELQHAAVAGVLPLHREEPLLETVALL